MQKFLCSLNNSNICCQIGLSDYNIKAVNNVTKAICGQNIYMKVKTGDIDHTRIIHNNKLIHLGNNFIHQGNTFNHHKKYNQSSRKYTQSSRKYTHSAGKYTHSARKYKYRKKSSLERDKKETFQLKIYHINQFFLKSPDSMKSNFWHDQRQHKSSKDDSISKHMECWEMSHDIVLANHRWLQVQLYKKKKYVNIYIYKTTSIWKLGNGPVAFKSQYKMWCDK